MANAYQSVCRSLSLTTVWLHSTVVGFVHCSTTQTSGALVQHLDCFASNVWQCSSVEECLDLSRWLQQTLIIHALRWFAVCAQSLPVYTVLAAVFNSNSSYQDNRMHVWKCPQTHCGGVAYTDQNRSCDSSDCGSWQRQLYLPCAARYLLWQGNMFGSLSVRLVVPGL
jgi:hypothetical protein